MVKWGLRGAGVVAINALTGFACFHDGGLVESGGAAQSSGAASSGADTGATTAGGSTTGAGTTGGTTAEATTGEPPPPPPPVGLDILFVVDNSTSMADEQALLVRDVAALFDATASRDIRVGVTTTDMGNPRCDAQMSTPEFGALVRSSCLDRLGEFTSQMMAYDFACTDRCGLTDAELAVTPTATALDPEPKLRPWIERTGGVTNLPGGVSLAQAFQCFAPQGVAGCGLESPLEAARAALMAANDPMSPQYGFLRDDADLLVVLVTDEMDCSYAPAGADIFTTNKVFWNDPNDTGPTSAVCFRAGAQCVGQAPVYESCAAVDKDATGNPTMDPALAVLRPIGHYIAFFQSLQAGKAGGARVFVRAIAGVPIGYEAGGVPLVFQDSVDAQVQKEFGIGFGCEQGPTTRAVPPLRILEVTQALPGSRIYSICALDYTATMAGLAMP